MFGRFWLLVEGESEVLLLQECARISGHHLFSEGICCVEFPTVGVEKLIRLADQLGIDWLMMVDKDKAGNDYVNSATKQLSGRNAADHIRQLPCGAIEAYLCSAGLGDVYKANISTQKAATITAASGSEVYWEQVTKAQSNAKSKPELVAEVVVSKACIRMDRSSFRLGFCQDRGGWSREGVPFLAQTLACCPLLAAVNFRHDQGRDPRSTA